MIFLSNLFELKDTTWYNFLINNFFKYNNKNNSSSTFSNTREYISGIYAHGHKHNKQHKFDLEMNDKRLWESTIAKI